MSTPSSLIVSNTGPLIALDACNQLELLRILFSRIVVPKDVEIELAAGGSTALHVGLTSKHRTWIEVLPLTSEPSPALLLRLDAGEAAVITLALEIEADLVLIDEKLGRKAARDEGLEVLGSVGLLVRAKKRGLLPEVKSHLVEIQKKIGLTQRLIEWAIIEAGEAP